MSICDLSKDYGAYRDKLVAVRGVDYEGLRQICPQSCASGPLPSFLDLAGTADSDWSALAQAERTVDLEAKKGRRLEIWVTAVGRLQTVAQLSPVGPCDTVGSRYGGYGHLGVFPAQIRVKYFRDLVIVENPQSLYDYSNVYHGAF